MTIAIARVLNIVCYINIYIEVELKLIYRVILLVNARYGDCPPTPIFRMRSIVYIQHFATVKPCTVIQ